MTTYENIINNMSDEDFESFINQFADMIEAGAVTAAKVIEMAKQCAGGLNK